MFFLKIIFVKCFFSKLCMNLMKLLRGIVGTTPSDSNVCGNVKGLKSDNSYLLSLAWKKKVAYQNFQKIPTFWVPFSQKTTVFYGFWPGLPGGGHLLLPMEWQLSPGQSRKQSVAAMRGGDSPEVPSRRPLEKTPKNPKVWNAGIWGEISWPQIAKEPNLNLKYYINSPFTTMCFFIFDILYFKVIEPSKHGSFLWLRCFVLGKDRAHTGCFGRWTILNLEGKGIFWRGTTSNCLMSCSISKVSNGEEPWSQCLQDYDCESSLSFSNFLNTPRWNSVVEAVEARVVWIEDAE